MEIVGRKALGYCCHVLYARPNNKLGDSVGQAFEEMESSEWHLGSIAPGGFIWSGEEMFSQEGKIERREREREVVI